MRYIPWDTQQQGINIYESREEKIYSMRYQPMEIQRIN